LDRALEETKRRANGATFPESISAVFRGGWSLTDTQYHVNDSDEPIQVVLTGPPRAPAVFNLLHSNGDVTLQMVQEQTIFEEIQSIRGIMRMYDGDKADTSTAVYEFELQG
jgi:hypothetical protein